MRLPALRRHCLSQPAATETIQWGGVHVFKVGGRMFATISMDGRAFDGLAFKVGDDSFHILIREPGIVPAPYLARAHWVKLERLDALPAAQLKAYIERAHGLIAQRLPRKTKIALGLPLDSPAGRNRRREDNPFD